MGLCTVNKGQRLMLWHSLSGEDEPLDFLARNFSMYPTILRTRPPHEHSQRYVALYEPVPRLRFHFARILFIHFLYALLVMPFVNTVVREAIRRVSMRAKLNESVRVA